MIKRNCNVIICCCYGRLLNRWWWGQIDSTCVLFSYGGSTIFCQHIPFEFQKWQVNIVMENYELLIIEVYLNV